MKKSEATLIEDPRLLAITDKVIDFMNKTAPEDWTKDQWNIFQKMWQDNKKRRNQDEQMKTASMSLADLKNSLPGNRLTSPN